MFSQNQLIVARFKRFAHVFTGGHKSFVFYRYAVLTSMDFFNKPRKKIDYCVRNNKFTIPLLTMATNVDDVTNYEMRIDLEQNFQRVAITC